MAFDLAVQNLKYRYQSFENEMLATRSKDFLPNQKGAHPYCLYCDSFWNETLFKGEHDKFFALEIPVLSFEENENIGTLNPFSISTVFIKKTVIPSGITWFQNQIWITTPVVLGHTYTGELVFDLTDYEEHPHSLYADEHKWGVVYLVRPSHIFSSYWEKAIMKDSYNDIMLT